MVKQYLLPVIPSDVIVDQFAFRPTGSTTVALIYILHHVIKIIMLAYFYCAAYTRMTMYESSPPCEQRRITFNDDGQRVQLA